VISAIEEANCTAQVFIPGHKWRTKWQWRPQFLSSKHW